MPDDEDFTITFAELAAVVKRETGVTPDRLLRMTLRDFVARVMAPKRMRLVVGGRDDDGCDEPTRLEPEEGGRQIVYQVVSTSANRPHRYWNPVEGWVPSSSAAACWSDIGEARKAALTLMPASRDHRRPEVISVWRGEE